MTLKRLVLGLAWGVSALGVCTNASAQFVQEWGAEAVGRTVHNLEAGFARKFSQLDEQAQQPEVSPSALSSIFPTWGFSPAVVPGIEWALQSVDVDQARVCMTLTVSDKARWLATIAMVKKLGYSLVESTCTSNVNVQGSPDAYPATFNAAKVLNRRNVLVKSVKPGSITIQGLSSNSSALPAVDIKSAQGAGFKTITLGLPLDAAYNVAVQSLSVRGQGFNATSNCGVLLPGTHCDITAEYLAEAPDHSVGHIRASLSTGEYLVLSLLGRR